MELLVLLLIAGLAGYLLAGSRFSKPIDETTDKVSKTTSGWFSTAEDWVKGLFKRNKKPAQEVIDVEMKTAPEETGSIEAAQPAARQSSRRKAEEER
jgi:hypothetical protein